MEIQSEIQKFEQIERTVEGHTIKASVLIRVLPEIGRTQFSTTGKNKNEALQNAYDFAFNIIMRSK